MFERQPAIYFLVLEEWRRASTPNSRRFLVGLPLASLPLASLPLASPLPLASLPLALRRSLVDSRVGVDSRRWEERVHQEEEEDSRRSLASRVAVDSRRWEPQEEDSRRSEAHRHQPQEDSRRCSHEGADSRR